MNNIISFSLWGDNPKYTIGAIENAKLQKTIYPDWKCRFYYDDSVPTNIITLLSDLGSEVVYKPTNSQEFTGLYWRFEVGFDDTVDRFIIRDTDSRLNLREKYAVDEWIDSKLPFHIMRDHRHHSIPILGATWGATKNFIPTFKDVYNNWIINIPQSHHVRGDYFYTDQTFLSEHIWPLIQNRHMAHDSHYNFSGHDKNFSFGLSNGLFVGQAYDVIDGKSIPQFVY